MKEAEKSEKSLPDHWHSARLGELTKEVSRVNPGDHPEKKITYIDISSIDNDRYSITEPTEHLGDEAPSRARQLIKEGDILFSTVRTYLRNIALVPQNHDGDIASTGFCVVRPSDVLDSQFFFYYSLTPDFVEPLNKRQRGTSYPAVRDDDVFEQVIPLPPLPEQRRIVAKIEELFSNLDAGMDDLQAAGQQLERYRLSVLQAAVEGRLTADWRRTHDPEPADELHDRIWNEKKQLYDSGEIRKPKERPEPEEDAIPFSIPERWSWIRITELMYNWRSGLEKRNSEQGPELKYPYVKMGDITNDGRLTLDSVTRVDAEPEDVEKYKLSRGDFLFNVRNSKKLVGKSCVFDVESDETYLFNNNILRVDFGGKVSTKYINYWFCSAAGRDMLEELKSSTTNVAAIYHKDFFTCIVPLPPLAEQKQIVDEVERLLSVADDAAATADREHTRAKRLRQSILKQAFSGQLVPHGDDATPPSLDGTSSEHSVSGTSDGSESDVEDLLGSADPSKQIEMDL